MVTSQSDRRARVRSACTLRVVCAVQYESGKRQLVLGTSVNLSQRGAALVLPQAPVRDQMILIRLERSDNGFFCQRSARVRHDRPITNGWIVGCEFAEPLTAGQLQDLMRQAAS